MIAGAKNGEVKIYKSFTFDGKVYSLYDCIYTHQRLAEAAYQKPYENMGETKS